MLWLEVWTLIGWKSVTVHREGDEYDKEKIAEWIIKIREVIGNYNPDNAFNMDNTGYFRRFLTKQGVSTKHRGKDYLWH